MAILDRLDDFVHASELLLAGGAKLPEVEYASRYVYSTVEKCAQRANRLTEEVPNRLAGEETSG